MKNTLVTLKTEKAVVTMNGSGQEVQELYMKNKSIMGANEEPDDGCGT